MIVLACYADCIAVTRYYTEERKRSENDREQTLLRRVGGLHRKLKNCMLQPLLLKAMLWHDML